MNRSSGRSDVSMFSTSGEIHHDRTTSGGKRDALTGRMNRRLCCAYSRAHVVGRCAAASCFKSGRHGQTTPRCEREEDGCAARATRALKSRLWRHPPMCPKRKGRPRAGRRPINTAAQPWEGTGAPGTGRESGPGTWLKPWELALGQRGQRAGPGRFLPRPRCGTRGRIHRSRAARRRLPTLSLADGR